MTSYDRRMLLLPPSAPPPMANVKEQIPPTTLHTEQDNTFPCPKADTPL